MLRWSSIMTSNKMQNEPSSSNPNFVKSSVELHFAAIPLPPPPFSFLSCSADIMLGSGLLGDEGSEEELGDDDEEESNTGNRLEISQFW